MGNERLFAHKSSGLVKDETSYFSYNLALSRMVKSLNDLQHYQLRGLCNRTAHVVTSAFHAIVTRIVYD